MKLVSLYKFSINLTNITKLKVPRMSQQKISQQKNIDLSVAIAPPKFQIPSDSLEDCPICMEKIIGVNISVTTCGHAFHCFCLLTAVESNEECPLCRHPLVKIEYETDDDEGENNNDGDDDSETIGSNSTRSSDEDEEDSIVTLEALTNKISNLGYTMKDLIYMLTPIRSDDPKYTEDYCENLFDTIDKIKDGRISLSQRDTRSYSQVLIGTASEEPVVQEITYIHEEENENEKEEVDIFNEVMTTIDIMIVRLENNIRPSSIIKYQWNPEVISY